ncbi:MAG: histidine kinase [Bacteroidota bacterium]
MKKSVVILIHFVFWILVYWSILTIISQFHRLMTIEIDSRLHALILTISCVPLVYFGYFAYPFLLNKRYNKLLIIFGLLFIIGFSLVAVIWDDGLIGLNFENVASTITYSAIAIFIGGGLKSLIHFIEQKKKQEELEKQNIRSELALLRTQLNPHFLFNTLHNIDTLIFENQNKASKSLIKLSDIMRYMLKDAKDDFVDLDKELENLNNYIELEKLRLKNVNFLKFSVSGNTKELRIAPMILLPFIENAFKHSVDSDSENGIIISIKVEDKIINFICENKIDKLDSDKDKTQGIGLETIKKRLEFIYPKKHRLNIVSNNVTFNVNLEIHIDDN